MINNTRRKYYSFLVCTFLLLTVFISHAQVNPVDSDLGECNYEPKISETKMWFNEKEHKVKNPEIKIRVGGIHVFNDQLYMVNKRFKTIDLFTFDFDKKSWILAKDSTLYHVLENICKDKFLASGLGGIEIIGDTLFTVGISKNPFSAININTQEVVYAPEFELPDYEGGENAEGISFSFPITYLAFHSNDYERDIEDTQRLIAFDVRNGKIVFNTQLNLSENRRDSTHGLTNAYHNVWHIKDNSLVKMNGENGKIIDKYWIEDISRPTSICYHNNSLWIVTYYGGLYEVPLICN